MWIDNQLYNDFEIMAKNKGWDDRLELINHALEMK
jgi:hypothetical protein